jgi:hypothetical protein
MAHLAVVYRMKNPIPGRGYKAKPFLVTGAAEAAGDY